MITGAVGNVTSCKGTSHDDTTLGGPKRKKKRAVSALEASVTSVIHEHTAYSLVCDIARVPGLLDLLRG